MQRIGALHCWVVPVNTAPSEQTLLPHGRGFSSQARESVASAAQTSSSFYFPTQIVWCSSTYISSSLERSWPCPRHSTTWSKVFSDWSPGKRSPDVQPSCSQTILLHPASSYFIARSHQYMCGWPKDWDPESILGENPGHQEADTLLCGVHT